MDINAFAGVYRRLSQWAIIFICTLAVHITGDGYRIVSLKHGSCAVS